MARTSSLFLPFVLALALIHGHHLLPPSEGRKLLEAEEPSQTQGPRNGEPLRGSTGVLRGHSSEPQLPPPPGSRVAGNADEGLFLLHLAKIERILHQSVPSPGIGN